MIYMYVMSRELIRATFLFLLNFTITCMQVVWGRLVVNGVIKQLKGKSSLDRVKHSA
eukprot:COSAG01_NODE_8697_length_2693_cov_2.548574_2_plen_57_part_00